MAEDIAIKGYDPLISPLLDIRSLPWDYPKEKITGYVLTSRYGLQALKNPDIASPWQHAKPQVAVAETSFQTNASLAWWKKSSR